MKRFLRSMIGIDQGETILFSDFERDGIMWTGEGPRQMRTHVTFSQPFVAPPAVTVGLTMWDMSNSANARADIGSEDVTEAGFSIVFRTWGDTRVARVRVGWQAIGPVRDEESWEV